MQSKTVLFIMFTLAGKLSKLCGFERIGCIMVIKRTIDGREIDIVLTQYEIHMIIEESDKDSARNDLDYH